MLAVDVDQELLVDAARAGAEEAWDQLLQRYQLPLYAYVFELVHQEQTALDIVQETFISAVRHVGALRDNRKFGSWLFGIAHQKCLLQFRRLHRAERVWDTEAEPSLDVPDDEAGPLDLLIRKEREEAFMTMLNRLPLPQRATVLLHFIEDFSLEEIAGITSVPLGTVKSRLHHAKQLLRRWMEEAA